MKVELPIFLYDTKLEEMGVSGEDYVVKLNIELNEVVGVRERIENGEDKPCLKTCIIYTKFGESFQIGKGYEEMNNIWMSNKNC